MAIIIKKRQVENPRPPAPLVEPVKVEAPQAAAPAEIGELPPARVCTFCKHPYVKPCDGHDEKCMNARFVRQRQAQREAVSEAAG
jgi:hypothetical protein